MNWIIKFYDSSRNEIDHQEFESFDDALSSLNLYDISRKYGNGYLKIVVQNKFSVTYYEVTLNESKGKTL